MRIYKPFFIGIPLAALLFIGFAASGIAQDTNSQPYTETKAPVILSTTPSDGESNVDLDSVVEITFSSHMDEKTINEYTLLLHADHADTMDDYNSEEMLDDQMKEHSAMKDSEKNRHHDSGAVNGTISYSDKVAVFTPDEELKEGTMYTFTVTYDVKNSENAALENDHEWSFTTTGTSVSSYSDKHDAKFDMDRDEYSESTMHDSKMHDSNMHDSTMHESAMDGSKMHDSTMHESAMDRHESAMDRHEYSERAMHQSSMDTTLKGKNNMIDLGKAGQFVMLAKTNINNGSESMISGQIGEGSVADKRKKEKDLIDSTKQRTSNQVLVWRSDKSDTTYLDVSEAIEDMMLAYSNASMQNGDDLTSHMNESFSDTVLTSGIHEWSDALNIESDVTLSGSEDDVWLFKVGDNLTVHENTVFTLTDGARADNVFWYVEGEVTIGKNAHFEGIILSKNEITLEKGAKMNGRMFSQASITLDDNTVTEPRTMAGQTSSTNR